MGLKAKYAHRPSGADCKAMLAFKAVILLLRQYGGQAVIIVVCAIDDMPWAILNAGIAANTPVVVNCKIDFVHKRPSICSGKVNGKVMDYRSLHDKAVAESQRAACKISFCFNRKANFV